MFWPLGLTTAVSTADTNIQKEIISSGKTTLVMSNDNINNL